MDRGISIEQMERQCEIQASQEVVVQLGNLAIVVLLTLNGFGVALAVLLGGGDNLALILFLAGLSGAMLTLATSYVLAQISLAHPGFLQRMGFNLFILCMVAPPLASFVLFVAACLMWGAV